MSYLFEIGNGKQTFSPKFNKDLSLHHSRFLTQVVTKYFLILIIPLNLLSMQNIFSAALIKVLEEKARGLLALFYI